MTPSTSGLCPVCGTPNVDAHVCVLCGAALTRGVVVLGVLRPARLPLPVRRREVYVEERTHYGWWAFFGVRALARIFGG